MSKNILFIDEDTIKQKSTVNANVDPKLIGPSIKYCQDVYLEPVLGTNLFRKIQADIESTGTTTGDYKTLLDNYILDVLTYYVLSELPMALGYKFFNKNVLKKNSENSTDAQNFELQQLVKWYRNKAEYYESQLMRYLVTESGITPYKFVEYVQTPGRCDYINPKKRPYASSIYLGNPGPARKPTFAELFQGNGTGSLESNVIDGGEA